MRTAYREGRSIAALARDHDVLRARARGTVRIRGARTQLLQLLTLSGIREVFISPPSPLPEPAGLPARAN
ncbi:hypothetical protein ACFXPW_08375 [Streptomyces goshikiensis]|uniref:hypothetical protein n=1 Tax=Streptomyces goshikiensis TaxID=1942 RepID=UPI0036B7AD35